MKWLRLLRAIERRESSPARGTWIEINNIDSYLKSPQVVPRTGDVD